MSQCSPLSICRLTVVDERDNDELEREAIISQIRMYLGLATFHLHRSIGIESREMWRWAHQKFPDHSEKAHLPDRQTVALYHRKSVTVSLLTMVC